VAKSNSANCETLVDLFSYVGVILKRLRVYPEVSVIPEVTLILTKIMAELVFVFAIPTKDVKDRPLTGESILINKSLSNVHLSALCKDITRGD
jgi:hypothetical protein